MPEVCEFCGGDEQVHERTIYGSTAKSPEAVYHSFYKLDVRACHICLDGVSVWNSMNSAAETLKKRGKETSPAPFHEVKCAFTYDIPKGGLEDTFRAFISQTLERRAKTPGR